MSLNRNFRENLGRGFFVLVMVLGPFADSGYGQISITGDVNPGGVTLPTWNVGGDLSIGTTGTGTMAISATGMVTSANSKIGENTGSAGTVTLSGGSWTNSGSLLVGDFGVGTLEISGTGSFSNGNATIGGFTGSTGSSATISSGIWTNSGYLNVGGYSKATMEISGSGAVSSTDGSIGNPGGSTDNSVTVSGGAWTNSGLLLLGNGTLEISGTGQVESNSTKLSDFGFSGTSKGIVNLNGGVLLTGQVFEGIGQGTFHFNGGTLRLKGSQSSLFAGFEAGDVTLDSGGGTIDTQSFNVATSYTLSGAGSLTKTGTGMLTLSGANVYTGATNVEEGILSFTGISNLGTGNVTVAGGELRIQGGGQLTNGESFVGVTGSGSGTAVVDGAGSVWTVNGNLHVGDIIPMPLGGTPGVLRLTDNGSAEVNGTLDLDIGGVIELGSGGNVTATGGIEAAFSTARLLANTDFLLPDIHYMGNFIFDTNGSEGTYAGVISSTLTAGVVVKRGEGVLNLTGANSFSQGIYVEEGTLLVNNTTGSATGSGDVTIVSGATLGGSGSIAGTAIIESGGILSPGNSPGILKLGALTLNSGSTTRMEINGPTAGTNYDQLQVTNTAHLDGTLDLVFGYVPTAGETFTLITADSFTGTFSDISTNLGAALLAEEFYNPTTFEITVNLAQQDFAPFAATPNQRAVAANLDTFSTTGHYQGLVDVLNLLNADELRAAFDLIAPEELSAMSNVGFANTRNVFNMLGNRVSEIHNGQQFSSNGLTLWDNSKKFQENLFAGTDVVPGGQLYVPKADDKRLGFFVSGQGTFGDVDGDGTGDDYDFSTGGMLLGSDYRLTENVAIGAYAGYQGSKSDTSGGSELESDSAKFGVYGTYFSSQGSWLSANMGGGYHSYDSERATVGGDALGSTNGTEINAQLTYGYDFKAGANKEWTFGPEASLGYTHLWIDGFNESGSAAPLQIQDQSNDSLRSTVLGKVSYDWKLNSGTWTLRPYARLGWQHEFMDDSQAISARFAGAGGVFTVNSSDQDPDSVIAGAGAQMLFSETISAQLGYSAEANADYQIHSINGSLNLRF